MSPIGGPYGRALPYDLTQLRYVRAILACGSMTAAAKELRVSQPTLSNAVRDLEERLGTTLFTRVARGMTPTETGRALARAADSVFALLRQAEEELHGIAAVPSGTFVVGCYHSFGALFLPTLVQGVAARAPAVELSFWEGIGARMIDAVIDRTIDFGVGTRSSVPARAPADLVVVPLFHDVVAVVRGKARPKADAPLFYVPRVGPCARIVERMRAAERLPARVTACGDLELV
ncbi:MAG TPA: LysR family transcriptional regulator, partial [Polyangiaceae bacterium]